jgi:hypothetical protein
VASRIKIDGLNPGAAPYVTTNNSCIGNSGNTLNFDHPVSISTVDWTHARTDQQEVTGHGMLGILSFTVPPTAVQGQTVDLTFELSRLINKEGHDITFNPVNASLKVGFPDHVTDVHPESYASVVPNPSTHEATLLLSTGQAGTILVSITNALGQKIWNIQYEVSAGKQVLNLPPDITPGLYSVHINGRSLSMTIKWIRQ